MTKIIKVPLKPKKQNVEILFSEDGEILEKPPMRDVHIKKARSKRKPCSICMKTYHQLKHLPHAMNVSWTCKNCGRECS